MQSVASFNVDAQFYQFYLMDEVAEPLIPEVVTDRDLAARVRVAPNIAVLQTADDAVIPLTVEVVEAAPPDDSPNWDHVVEFSVVAPSGSLVVAGVADHLPKCPRVAVKPGTSRARASFRAVDDVEQCRLSLWPGADQPPVILKQGTHAS